MVSNTKIVADSSFYLCFLDDINKSNELIRIIDHFDFLLTPIVRNEIIKSKNYVKIKNHKNIQPTDFSISLGEILVPLFGKEEITKGEHEVIGVSYLLYQLKENFYFILDDSSARNFVLKNLKCLSELMIGTIRFIAICFCKFNIFNKRESLELLNSIEHSKFRISKYVLEKTKQYIDECAKDVI